MSEEDARRRIRAVLNTVKAGKALEEELLEVDNTICMVMTHHNLDRTECHWLDIVNAISHYTEIEDRLLGVMVNFSGRDKFVLPNDLIRWTLKECRTHRNDVRRRFKAITGVYPKGHLRTFGYYVDDEGGHFYDRRTKEELDEGGGRTDQDRADPRPRGDLTRLGSRKRPGDRHPAKGVGKARGRAEGRKVRQAGPKVGTGRGKAAKGGHLRRPVAGKGPTEGD